MRSTAKLVLVGLVSLVIGAAGGGGYGMMQVDAVKQQLTAATQEKERAVQDATRLRKLSDAAARIYGIELGKLVNATGAPAPAPAPVTGQPAVTPAAGDDTKALDSARAILARRDGFRASLDGVRAAMNSEMDALAAELGNASPDAGKVKELLDSLKTNWPNKEKDLEAATRKLLNDLGLAQAPADSKK